MALAAEGFHDLARGVEGGGAGKGDARVSAGAAEEESADGRLIAGEAEKRAHGEELVEGEFAVRDVAAGETVIVFEVERSDDAARKNLGGKIGGVFGESLHGDIGKSFALIFPVGWRPTFRG